MGSLGLFLGIRNTKNSTNHMKSKVSIVIVHWNTPDSLKRCLNVLKEHFDDLQIVVVDNASSEKPTFIKKDFTGVELIKNDINRGFAFACNQGLMRAKAEWVLFLNPDTEVTYENIIEIIRFSIDHNLDACSPEFIDSNYKKPLPSWRSFLVEFSPLHRVISLNVFKTKTLFGGCLLAKKSSILSLGGWDERFFLWFEDSDLTYRLIKEKYNVGWAPVVIKHYGGESFRALKEPFKKHIFFLSMSIFAKKHFGFFGNLIITLIRWRFSRNNILPHISSGTSIVVPNMKADLLKAFLKKNEQFLSDLDEVIIVSSGITQEKFWEWKEKYPHFRIVFVKKNNGFASTVNIGFRVARSKWIGTVNDDVILTSEWVKKLLNCADVDTGSLNPIIHKTNGEIESCGIEVLDKGKALPITLSVTSTKKCMQVDATNAACVLYGHKALQEIGLFDEKFESYLEDIDLSLRIKRKNYKSIVSTEVGVTHIGQSTSISLHSKKQFLDFKNWILVIIKNWGVKNILIHFPSIFVERLRNISGILKNLFIF